MGKLFFDLDSVDVNVSDEEFWTTLVKYYQSNLDDEIYKAIQRYDVSMLPESKLSIFVNMARRRFVYGKKKMDINFLPDANYYTIEETSLGKFKY